MADREVQFNFTDHEVPLICGSFSPFKLTGRLELYHYLSGLRPIL